MVQDRFLVLLLLWEEQELKSENMSIGNGNIQRSIKRILTKG